MAKVQLTLFLRLQNKDSRIHLLPQMGLMPKAKVLSEAAGSISLDTGLAHMAAALGIPNVSLYGPTDANFTGTYGNKQAHVSASEPACAPCLKNICTYEGAMEHKPACMTSIKP